MGERQALDSVIQELSHEMWMIEGYVWDLAKVDDNTVTITIKRPDLTLSFSTGILTADDSYAPADRCIQFIIQSRTRMQLLLKIIRGLQERGPKKVKKRRR